MLRAESPAQLTGRVCHACCVGLLLCSGVWDTAGPALTFGQCDLSDAVALPKPHRHGADQVGWHLLLGVLFPAQGQGRVAACGDQMLMKQAVLRA